MQLEASEEHQKVPTPRLGHQPQRNDKWRIPEKTNVSEGQMIPF